MFQDALDPRQIALICEPPIEHLPLEGVGIAKRGLGDGCLGMGVGGVEWLYQYLPKHIHQNLFDSHKSPLSIISEKMAWMEKGAGRAWVFFAHFQHCERTIRWYRPFNSDLVFQKIRWHCFTWIRLTTFLPSVPIVQKVRSAGAPASNWLRPMLRGEFLSLPLFLRLCNSKLEI